MKTTGPAKSHMDLPYILTAPDDPWLVYVLAHGAGAPMTHKFMGDMADGLKAAGIASLRYNFPYMEAGGRRPDPPARLEATVGKAIAAAAELLPGVPMIAGGKSMGGRMTSQYAARHPDAPIQGIAFLGFPLHYPNKPARARAEHLFNVVHPMLFVQGTRDTLADLELMQEVTTELQGKATLKIIDGGDHSFAVLKRSGRAQDEVMREVVSSIESWSRTLLQGAAPSPRLHA